MYVRLAFAVAVHVDPDVLLVDEVLAVGDEPFQRKCMDRIREFQSEGRTIVVVTHSLDQVADLCDRAIVLEHGVVQIDGDPMEALRHLRADFETHAAGRDRPGTRDGRRCGGRRDRRSDTASTRFPGAALIAGGRVVSVTLTVRGRPAHDFDHLGRRHVRSRSRSRSTALVRDGVIGLGIDSSMGQTVYGTNTKMMGMKLPPISGSTSYTFRLPSVALGEGQYTVIAAVHREGGMEMHRYTPGVPFSVLGAGNSIGFVDVRTEFVGPSVSGARPLGSQSAEPEAASM